MATLLTIAVIILVLFVLFKVFKVIIRIVLIVIFLLLAYLTNPDAAAHEEAVKTKADKTDTRIARRRVIVRDFKIFSLTKIATGKEETLVGAGLFTKVWIFRDLSDLSQNNLSPS